MNLLQSVANAVQQVTDSAGSSEAGSLVEALGPNAQTKLIQSLAAIALLIVLRRLLLRLAEKRVKDPGHLYWWSKSSSYAVFGFSALIVFNIWVSAIQSLGTFLGLLTAGLAIALKDLVADLAGWFFIIWRKPFELGDRIQIGTQAGDVVDIRPFAFTMMEIGNWVDADQSTGRMIHMPNAKVFTEPLANYTAGFPFLWNEMGVMVTFESDWRGAKQLLVEIVDEATAGISQEAEKTLRSTSRRFLIHYSKLTPIVYTSVKDSGIMLSVRYLCHPRHRRGTSEAIWERVLDAFSERSNIDLAYPTHRVYLNPIEGKDGARSEWPGAAGGDDPGPAPGAGMGSGPDSDPGSA